jgi:hypothetical protein
MSVEIYPKAGWSAIDSASKKKEKEKRGRYGPTIHTDCCKGQVFS